jgi:CRP-like cAMP-binding protein
MEAIQENRNGLLSSMSRSDLNLLQPHLEFVDLAERVKIEVANRPIPYVYFPESGLVSVVAATDYGFQTEVGMIGREGVTGFAVMMGDGCSPFNAVIQSPGRGYRIQSDTLQARIQESVSLSTLLHRWVQVFAIQAAYTALASARANIEQRLGRWLLMAQDRLGDDVLLTHEFLAESLGTRRASITEGLHTLARRGFIENGRRRVTIRNRIGLEKHAERFYGTAEAEYLRLVGGEYGPGRSAGLQRRQ